MKGTVTKQSGLWSEASQAVYCFVVNLTAQKGYTWPRTVR